MTITAAAVKSLRERTGLPMMDCKEALKETGGDEDAAVDFLRKKGLQVLEKRAGRATTFGRFGLYVGADKPNGAIVELKCESAPVTSNEEFIQLANDLAQQLATGPAITDSEQLLDQPSPSKPGQTLREVRDEMFNRIREVFNIGRFEKFEGGTGGYSHNSGTISGVLVSVDGGNDSVAKDVSMHIAAMRPAALSPDELDQEVVEKERSVLRAAALAEGKPENIVDKMVDGRMQNFFAERTLLAQAFVKDDKATVGEFAEQNGMKILKYVHWEMIPEIGE
jgi:elongation factor Ts